MSHLLDDDEDLPRRRGDRELTLSTGAILGIFFGLTLICGFFFAFGYNMGHKASTATVATAGDSDNYTSASAAYSSSKPSAGSPLGQPLSPSAVGAPGDIAGAPPHSATPAKAANAQPSAPVASHESAAEEEPKAAAPAAPVARMPAISSNGTFVVQVAAVSHQEDAELLVSSLQKKGYTVAARNEPGDKLVHVQVGPFSDHKDADAIKQRLQTDGFHAMIKQL